MELNGGRATQLTLDVCTNTQTTGTPFRARCVDADSIEESGYHRATTPIKPSFWRQVGVTRVEHSFHGSLYEQLGHNTCERYSISSPLGADCQ